MKTYTNVITVLAVMFLASVSLVSAQETKDDPVPEAASKEVKAETKKE